MGKAPGRGVLIAAGGTGGHIFPALAVAAELRRRDLAVAWLGTARGLEMGLVPESGYPLHVLEIQGIRGKGATRWLLAPGQVGQAVLQARQILREVQAGVVLGMGGYVSAPAGLAARSLGIPLIIHEQNSIPGLANRLLAPLARRVFTGFPESGLRKAQWVGNPVRPEIAQIEPPEQRLVERKGVARLLIMGGSQGAQVLNELAVAALGSLPVESRPEIWHQAGKAHWEACQQSYRRMGIQARVEPFIENMAEALAWADLALCRAGAATIAELCAAGLGSLLVPYPFAVDDHQAANARFLEDAGAAKLLRQESLRPRVLAEALAPLLADSNRRLSWAQAARRQAKIQAAAAVAAACAELTHA